MLPLSCLHRRENRDPFSLSFSCSHKASGLTAAGCSHQAPLTSEPITDGNPQTGKQAIMHYGCVACHEIKGVEQANGVIGPSLEKIRERVYVGGVAPNTPDNLVKWIMHPKELSPKTAMPELGVSETDARDIAAYLYSQ
jgi:cytochrome c